MPPVEDFPAELHGAPYAAVLGMYAGPADEGEQALQPLRELGEPLADFTGRMHLRRRPADLRPRVSRRTPLLLEVDEPAVAAGRGVDVLVEQMRRAPSKHSTIDVWLNGGAIARVADVATAFSRS